MCPRERVHSKRGYWGTRSCRKLTHEHALHTHVSLALVCQVACELYCTSVPHIINARRMRTRVTVVGLFVCVSVCYRSTACMGHLCNKMNVPANFAPNSKCFQLRNFTKKLSFTSYSLFFVFSIAKSAIFQFPV